MTVAPLMATLWAFRVSESTNMPNAPGAGTEFSSSGSSKVTTRVSSFTAALTNPGAVVSAVVLLVTVWLEKASTSAIPVPAYLSRFVPGV